MDKRPAADGPSSRSKREGTRSTRPHPWRRKCRQRQENMLKKVKSRTTRKSRGLFAIVASRYNGRYVDSMLRAARSELQRVGASVKVVRVRETSSRRIVQAREGTRRSRSDEPAGALTHPLDRVTQLEQRTGCPRSNLSKHPPYELPDQQDLVFRNDG